MSAPQIGRARNSRRLLASEQQNLDALSTFNKHKYGHLDVIINRADNLPLNHQMNIAHLIIGGERRSLCEIDALEQKLTVYSLMLLKNKY